MVAKGIKEITRGELEKKLERYERRATLFTAAEQVASIGYFEWDYELDCLITCSEQYASIFEMSVAEVIAAQDSWSNYLQFVHPDDQDVFSNLADRQNQSAVRETKFKIVLKNGKSRHIRRMDLAVIDDSRGKMQAFGLCQDITVLVERELELVYRETLSEQAESITEIGHYIYDELNQKHLYISPGYARIHGVEINDYLNSRHTLDDVLQDVHEDDRARVLAANNEYERRWQPFTIDYRVVHPNGEVRWIRELSKPQQYRDGKVFKTLGVVQDITQRVNREQELLNREVVALQAEEITEIGHFIFDEVNECYLHVSPGLTRIRGLTREQLTGEIYSFEDDMEAVVDEDRKKIEKLYAKFMQEQKEWRIEYRIKKPGGEVRWIRELGRAHRIEDGVIKQSIGVQQDITEQKLAAEKIMQANEKLEDLVEQRTQELASTVEQLEGQIEERKKIEAELVFLANHDALTGLPSLRLCKDRLDRSLADSRRNGGASIVMFLDLDGFKEINDNYGHESGDAVLKVTADRIKAGIRETDTVARIGGDEFIIILSRVTDAEVLDRIAAGLISQIGELIRVQQHEVSVGASIGIAIYPGDGTTTEELMQKADKAMYKVKKSGKNSYRFAGARELVSRK